MSIEIFFAIYLVIGVLHSFKKMFIVNVMDRPMMAIKGSSTQKLFGFLLLAAIWPISMLA